MISLFRRHLRAVLLVCVCLGVLPSYLWSFSLSGASEAPSILVGDTFIVNRAAYDLRLPYSRIALLHIASPKREDMIQAILPAHIGVGIKRVIGLPGETIEVRENRVFIDGAPLSERSLNAADFAFVPMRHRMGSMVVMEAGHWVAFTPGVCVYRNSAPIHLGPGEYFLMGDNRDNSLDSRAFGAISRESILGKVIAVLATGKRAVKGE